MTIDTFFELQEDARATIIEDIASKLPEEQREKTRERARKIVSDYVGRDIDAVSVMLYAAERGRFDEFADKLDELYKERLQYVHPEARRLSIMPGAVIAERTILGFYEQLGIKPRQN